MSLPDIETLDIDGALREAEEHVAGDSRADFFRKAALSGGALLGSGALLSALPSVSHGQVPKSDVDILNYALTLEFLEEAFYKQGLKNIDFETDGAEGFTRTVRKHETAHVKALKDALGNAAVKKPRFGFGKAVRDEDTFLATAYVLENTGVRAYSGQAGRIKTPAILAAAASILTIEARHAGAIAVILDKKAFNDGRNSITPDGAFDSSQGMKKILRQVGRTGFIKGN